VKVEVRLFATLAPYLPPGGRDGAAVVDVPEGATPRDLARVLGIPMDLERVVLVNGTDPPADQPLRDHDVITLFPPLAGGRH
jgi:molybdopterin converting factor small subunit